MDDIIRAAIDKASDGLARTFVPGKTYIPPAAPSLHPDDVGALVSVALQYWYTEWKYCAKFERELSSRMSKKFVTLVNSGSSALLVAISAATSRHRNYTENRGQKYIITCATGFPTTVSPIYQLGFVPIYVDMNLDLTPNLDQIKSVIRDFGVFVCGAVFAHTLGFPFDEAEIRNILGPERFLIADCCDAFGAVLKDGRSVGSCADISTLSFFPSHHIMAGEGGAVMTDDSELNEIARSVSNWGRSCFCRPGENNTCGKRFDWSDRGNLPEGWDHKYIFDRLGYNLKMTEFQGALGYSQIMRSDAMVSKRRLNYAYLYDQIARHEYLEYIELIAPVGGFSPFGFPILVKPNFEFTTRDMIAYLEEHRVGTRRLFAGNLLCQPGFMHLNHVAAFEYAGSDRLMNDMFWISVSPSLSMDMIDYMVYVIDQFFIEHDLV